MGFWWRVGVADEQAMIESYDPLCSLSFLSDTRCINGGVYCRASVPGLEPTSCSLPSIWSCVALLAVPRLSGRPDVEKPPALILEAIAGLLCYWSVGRVWQVSNASLKNASAASSKSLSTLHRLHSFSGVALVPMTAPHLHVFHT